MTKDKLIVAEVFYSIQGEGQTMGVPSVFLRLGGCNLLCKGAGWTCDSIEVWKKGIATPFNEVIRPEWIKRLAEGAHLVITGGEPLLHQVQLNAFIQWFYAEYKFLPITEMETNGTIIPRFDVLSFVNYWNCSPKLSTVGEPKAKRINELALKMINEKGDNPIFKFVISCDSDVLEILNDFAPFISMQRVVLMPAGSTRKELFKTRLLTMSLAISMGLRYCDRLHIITWNKKTGV